MSETAVVVMLVIGFIAAVVVLTLYREEKGERREKVIEENVKQGNQALAAGDPDLAIAFANEAIRHEPSNADALRLRSAAYRGRKAYGEAINDLSKAIQLNPTNGANFTERGQTFFDMGQYEKAIADFSNAIRLNPSDDGARKRRADAYAKRDLPSPGNAPTTAPAELENPDLAPMETPAEPENAVPAPMNTPTQLVREARVIPAPAGPQDADPAPMEAPTQLVREEHVIPTPSEPQYADPAAIESPTMLVREERSYPTPVRVAATDKKFNAMALTGFIIGIVSVALYALVLIPILAIVFSAIGLGTFRPEAQKGKWMAATGLGLGILYTLMGLGVFGR